MSGLVFAFSFPSLDKRIKGRVKQQRSNFEAQFPPPPNPLPTAVFVSIGLIMPGNGLAGWLGSLMVWGLSLAVMFSMGLLIEKSGSLGGRLHH